MDSDDGHLGMSSPITRRDFLNGVAVGTTGAMALPALAGQTDATAASAQAGVASSPNPAYYPPALTGMRGSHTGSFEVMHAVRDRRSWTDVATDTGERYDLVVVGGGISGLAAAYYFRAAVGPAASVLVLDNHDDFGGHAKRNEFTHDGRMLMLNGGTLNIEAPKQYSDVAMGLLRRIGIDIDRFETQTAHDRATYQRMGLRNAVFFPKEKFGEDRLVAGTPGGSMAPGALERLPGQGAAAGRGARRHRPPPGRQPAGLHGGIVGCREEAAAHADELPGLPAQGREGASRRRLVLPGAHHRPVPDDDRRGARVLRLELRVSRLPGPEARADPAGGAVLRTGWVARARAPGASQRGRPLGPLPRRQRHDRPAAGSVAAAGRRPRHDAGGHRHRPRGLREARQAGFTGAHPAQ